MAQLVAEEMRFELGWNSASTTDKRDKLNLGHQNDFFCLFVYLLSSQISSCVRTD